MNVQIKSATIDDLADVQKLNLELFKKEYQDFDPTLNRQWTFGQEGEKYFRRRIIKDEGCVFVARIKGETVGYLAGGLIDENTPFRLLSKFAELENMFVLDKYRGRGIGTKLYQAFVDWCKTKKVGRVRVVVSAGNVGGVNFYRKNGFVDYVLTLEKRI